MPTQSDIATANFSSNNVSVLLNNGAGGFSAANNFGVGSLPRAITTVVLMRRKIGSCRRELNSNNVSVLFGDGTGGLLGLRTSPPRVPFP